MISTGNRNVRSLLEQKNDSTPESIFLIWENNTVTYRELNEKVNSLANGLLDLGVRKGDRVTIHLYNSPEFIYSFFALLKIGAVAVLSNINNLLEEFCYTVSHSNSAFVITESEFFDLVRKAQLRIPTLKKILLSDVEKSSSEAIAVRSLFSQFATELKGIDVSIDDDATIMYTSGTSAKPKGVLYLHGNHVFGGEAFAKQVRLAPSDRYLCVIPLFHQNALLGQLLPAVTAGASIALFRKFSSSRFGAQIRECNATIITIAGPLLKFILSTPTRPEDAQNSLRAVISGANILTHEEYQRFTRRFNVPLINWYGLTESPACPLCSPIDGKRKENSIGLPALGREVRIVNDTDEEVPPGQIGELVLSTLPKYSVMKEYYKDPQTTSETLKNGWLHTGDLAYMDEEGYFYFVERKKEIIKVGGENVSAREVEKVLNQHPCVEESAVIGVLDKLGNEAIKAFIMVREGKRTTEQDLQEYCSQEMAKFKVPKFFEFRNDLPRTAVGKIEKKKLREMHSKNK